MLRGERVFKIFVGIIIFISLLTSTARASNLFLNGNREDLMIKQGRTMLSLNQVEEAFDTRVYFNEISGEIRLQNPAVQISARLGSNIAFVNSRPEVLSLPIKKIDNQVMLPLYFLHNIYGGRLSWNSRNKSVNYDANKLKSISYNRNDKGLIINLETELSLDYKIDYIKESKQLIVDLYQVSFVRFKQELLDDKDIDLIRVSKKGVGPAITRVTIGLKDNLDYEIDKEANEIKIKLREKQKKVKEVEQNKPNKPEKAIEEKKVSNYNGELIILDPGHGGSDTGAIGFSGLKEKAVNMELARKTEAKLKEKGFNVKMTRTSDEFISLSDRARFANQLESDFFISIHTNYHSRQEVNGVETYAHYNSQQEDWALAWYVQDGILKQTNATDHGLKAANFAVLRQTRMPAILVEAGFLSNPREESKLRTNSYQQKIARGIVDGIVNFWEEDKPPN